MADVNGSGQVGDRLIGELLAPLRQRELELLAERDAMLQLVSGMDAELRRVRRVLKAADDEPGKPGPKRKGGPSTLSQERLDVVVAAIREHAGADDAFTSNDVVEWTSLPKDRVTVALRMLREQELVRLLGRSTLKPGQRGLAPYAYKVSSSG